MRKLNLGKLRCSTQSAAKNQSLSGSSARDQSQTTISSFFITKHCPVNDPSSSETGRTTADGNKLTKGAKRCASNISHSENKNNPSTHSKRQRISPNQSIKEDGIVEDHVTLNNKEVLSSSTMAKLNCFRKDSIMADSQVDKKLRNLPVTEIYGDRIEPDKDHKNKSNGGAIYDKDDDGSEPMDFDERVHQENLNITKFACTSRPSGRPIQNIKSVAEKNETQRYKPVNLRTKSTYTPLELQFLEVKSKYPDVILLVECGYRYRFFGEDSEIAAKELNITSHWDHNFKTASIPTHRLHVHVKRLVSKGHKVGVVKQTETAALKAAGENKSKVFTRELEALYTKTTLVGEDMKTMEDLDEADSVEMGSGYLMCLVESDPQDSKISSDRKLFGLVAVQPSTGDVIYDDFQDGPSCMELEAHLEHICPEELLLPESLTIKTENFIKDFVTRVQRPEDSIRLERMPDQFFDHSTSLKCITEFYEEQKPVRNEELCKVNITQELQENSSALEIILKLPKSVQSCFAALVKYLKDFRLEKIFRLISNFSRFSVQNKFLKLNGQTLRNLEIFKNQTNGNEKSSLFWIINHTTTAFGRRLLKKWISQPLRDVSEIEKRLDAVTELCGPSASCLASLKGLLSQLPDLERGLCTICHKKCTPAEFVTITKSLVRIAKHLQSNKDVATSKLESSLLRNVFTEVPTYLEDVEDFLRLVDEKAAKDGDKTKLFCDLTQFPMIMKCNLEIEKILTDLKNHRSEFRQVLRHPSLDYCCVSGNEFLIEVRNTNLKTVPADWIKISATKQVSRFRTPFVEDKFKLLCQWREQLSICCQEAWLEFLALFSEACARYRRAVCHIATLDCLFSLATVASQRGFTRPVVKDCEAHIYIKQGRHPVLDTLLSENEQFVPNDTQMDVNSNRCMIITGPNMGGKSSYIKQVALIVILSQVGSFIPAEEARVGVLDAIFTRMGATDNIYKGQSTFMVELQETSDIIAQATPKSLVILDELGRGTSTHDGTAIAYATAHHFISKIASLTLFVTHYPSLAELDGLFPNQVTNSHMAFMTSEVPGTKHCADGGEGEDNNVMSPVPSVTFLYHLVNGAAARSYGLNVARLAGIPNEIINTAAAKSREMENLIMSRRSIKTSFQEIFSKSSTTREVIEQLRTALEKISPDF